MILLDTNHLTVLRYPEDSRFDRLVSKLNDSIDLKIAIPVVVLEEQMRGWLAMIHGAGNSQRHIDGYDRLISLIRYFSEWEIIRYDQEAAAIFERLRSERVRVGTMDLRIGAIALANNATLLSANTKDFGKIPGLHVEDWLR